MGAGSRGLAAEWAALTDRRPGAVRLVLLGAAGGLLLSPVLAVLKFGAPPWLHTPLAGIVAMAVALAIYGGCTVWLCLTDVRERRLPNPVVALATLGLVLPLAAVSLVWGSASRLGWSLAATAALTGITLFAWWCAPNAVGGGDVKLMPAAAFLAAWAHPVAGPVAFTLLVCGALALTGVVALMRRRSSVPLGPILLGASWAAAVVAVVVASNGLLTGA